MTLHDIKQFTVYTSVRQPLDNDSSMYQLMNAIKGRPFHIVVGKGDIFLYVLLEHENITNFVKNRFVIFGGIHIYMTH